mmetsp:Transcript_4926/g.11544  ORF Transcript_4926/g.11544 Transcript_4926/m.11544 type:complete len:247 (+) Transcript_4926:433-1173(+)
MSTRPRWSTAACTPSSSSSAVASSRTTSLSLSRFSPSSRAVTPSAIASLALKFSAAAMACRALIPLASTTSSPLRFSSSTTARGPPARAASRAFVACCSVSAASAASAWPCISAARPSHTATTLATTPLAPIWSCSGTKPVAACWRMVPGELTAQCVQACATAARALPITGAEDDSGVSKTARTGAAEQKSSCSLPGGWLASWCSAPAASRCAVDAVAAGSWHSASSPFIASASTTWSRRPSSSVT